MSSAKPTEHNPDSLKKDQANVKKEGTTLKKEFVLKKDLKNAKEDLNSVSLDVNSSDDDEPRPVVSRGLMSWEAITYMALWYFFSLTTLFLNKHILSTLHAPSHTLAFIQMFSTFIYGALKVYAPAILKVPGASSKYAVTTMPSFYFDMLVVGLMRFLTVVLGLISLTFVAVSFTETIKSTAPFFTVLFAYFMLKETTTLYVNLSLVPIVLGLILCSSNEFSFHPIGFGAAVLNICIDCIQNVFSKKLLSAQYSFVELQFYTSAAALAIQLPLSIFLQWFDWDEFNGISWKLAGYLVLDGISFHLQSVTAYAVMNFISPVTQSVANTVKRAMLIWLSILYFDNPITPFSALGTMMVICGVLMYNFSVSTPRLTSPPAASTPSPLSKSTTAKTQHAFPALSNPRQTQPSAETKVALTDINKLPA